MVEVGLGTYAGGIFAIIGAVICIYWYIYWSRNFQGELLTDGPYGIVRHPFYAGFILLALGVAIALPYYEARLLLVFTLAVMVVFIPKEENELLEEYGEKYQKYMKEVPWRLVPYVY